MRTIFLVTFVAWHVASFDLSAAAGQKYAVQIKGVENSISNFASKSFKFVANDPTKNVVYSPFSTWMILTMASMGASGQTRSDMQKLLAVQSDESKTAIGVMAMMNNFEKVTDYKLRTANRIFMNNHYRLTSYFGSVTEIVFKSKLQTVNFQDSETTAKIINNWVAEKTDQLIKKLVKPDALEAEPKLFLANAIYFKGSWKNKFNTQSTLMRGYHVGETKSKMVPMMDITRSFNNGELPDVQAKFVELPYMVENEANAMSMFIVLPDKYNGLATLIENFENYFEQLFSKYNMESEVHLSLPKFKIESSINLRDALETMGSGNMFSPSANFSKIDATSRLSISRFGHKALIEVDENGSEAAAATGAEFSFKSARRDPVRFDVNRPFVCVIATKTKVPLFVAVVTDPTGSSGSTVKASRRLSNSGRIGTKKYRKQPIAAH